MKLSVFFLHLEVNNINASVIVCLNSQVIYILLQEYIKTHDHKGILKDNCYSVFLLSRYYGIQKIDGIKNQYCSSYNYIHNWYVVQHYHFVMLRQWGYSHWWTEIKDNNWCLFKAFFDHCFSFIFITRFFGFSYIHS